METTRLIESDDEIIDGEIDRWNVERILNNRSERDSKEP
jgi:hypothetical protein